MNTNYLLNSIYSFMGANIPNIYLYKDSIVDISMTTKCTSKTDLPLGTETTFILRNKDYNIDFTGKDFKYWYIRFTDNGIDKYRVITNYNSTTGQIIISSAFGKAMTTTDEFDLLCLDNLFLKIIPSGDMTISRKVYNKEYCRIYLLLQTKNDSNKVKINDFMDLIKTVFYSNDKVITIYNGSNVKLGNGNISGDISFSEKINADNNIQSYIGTFLVEYITKYS